MIARYSFLLGGALFAFAVPAAAQTANTPADAEEQARAEDGETIIVSGRYTLPDAIDTATGLGLTVRETPQSVSIMTAQRILDQNLLTARDVIINSVGVSANQLDDVRNEFFARGFQITNTQLDGVPVPWSLAGDTGETVADLSIYERVEIVRGATGLLSGAGDPSASVNFVRKHADSTDWTGYVSAGYASWDTWRVSGDVGGAITSDGRIRVRAVGRYEDGESFVDLYKNKKFVLYGVAEADITESTLLRAGISHQEGNPRGSSWGNLPSFYSDGTRTNYPRSKSATADWAYWKTSSQNIFATIKQDFGNDWSVVANYNRNRNKQDSKLLYLSGTVDKATGDIQFSFPYRANGARTQNSFDVQLKGKLNVFGRDHELVLGALHSKQKIYDIAYSALSFPPGTDFETWDGSEYPDPGFSATGTRVVDETIKQTGVYGALRLNVADQFKLIGGGRIASWKRRGYGYSGVVDYGDSGVFIPYVGALFDLTPNHRLYASFTKIFQPQSALDRDFNVLDPLEGNAYEIGLKSAFFNDALQTSLALFRIEQDNVAVVDGAPIIPPGGGLPQQPYRAVKGTTSEGFEVEVTGSPLPGWNVNLGYSQFKAKDADGNAVATNQPRKLLKLFTTYTIDNILHGFTFGGGVNYRSKAYSPGTNPVTGDAVRLQQGGYALVSLMVRLNVTEQFQLQANVDNLFDKKYFAQIGWFEQYRYGAPRNFNVSATYKF